MQKDKHDLPMLSLHALYAHIVEVKVKRNKSKEIRFMLSSIIS
jgi:hypothetical protein